MNKKASYQSIVAVAVLYAVLLGALIAPARADLLGGQVPQIPAFLPTMTDVPMKEKLPIDGEWVISSIKKRIRIEGGRAYVLDPWVHMLVLKVEPLMVVLQDLQRTGPGQYTGRDLPLMGQLQARMAPDGSLSVSVAGIMGPASYSLIPIRIDDQQSFDREKSGRDAQPAPLPQQPIAQPPPSPGRPDNKLENCKKLDVDPATGNVVCMD